MTGDLGWVGSEKRCFERYTSHPSQRREGWGTRAFGVGQGWATRRPCSISRRLGQGQVGAADVAGGEDAVERGDFPRRNLGEGAFDVVAAALLAIDQAEDSGDDHAGVARGFDGGDGGSAGGADVVDDDHGRAGLKEAFDAAAGAVVFFLLAHQETVDEGGRGAGVLVVEFEFGGEPEHFVVVGERPRTGGGGVGDQRVGAHGQAAHCGGVRHMFAEEFVENHAGEAATFGVQRGGAAVDVVVGLMPAGQGEVAEAEGEGSDEIEKGDAGVGGHLCQG